MAILIPCYKLAYFPIPKIACTSIKQTIFQINNGFDLSKVMRNEEKMRKRCRIHAIYKSRKHSEKGHEKLGSYTTFAVIRDPMRRILSAYSNRVLYHRALEKPAVAVELEKRGLQANPDLNQFVMELEQYREVAKQVFSHTRPLAFFLGQDLSRFDNIFKIGQMPELEKFLSERTGREISIPNMQTGGKKQKLESLTDEAFDKLRRFCEPDYELIKDYLPKPERTPMV